jgi:small GTP-binding protein
MFDFDVFLSHNSRDKPAVRALAQRLRQDGLRVFMDEDDIEFGDSIPLTLERALEKSRVLIMMMSDDFFASKWATLERHTFLFRDATNEDRRFIPLLLHDCRIPDAIKQFKYADWRTPNDEVYSRLLKSCQARVYSDQEAQAVVAPDSNSHIGSAPIATNGLQSVPDNSSSFQHVATSEQQRTPAGSENALAEVVMRGHTDFVRSVAFSHDGKFTASASTDKTLRVWDVETRKCLATLKGHTDFVWSVAFHPKKLLFASASNDNTLRLWDVETKKCLSKFEGHMNSVRSVAFSPSGNYLASASTDKTVKLWNTETRKCVATLEGHIDSVRSVAFSHDGKFLASASDDNTLRLWSLETKKCLTIFEGHTSFVLFVAFNYDGTFLASASNDGTLRLWGMETGECFASLEGHTGAVWSVAFSPDGKLLASASADKTLRLWSLETRKCFASLEGHTGAVWSVAFSPDGKLLASASADKTLRLWKMTTLGVMTGYRSFNTPAYVNARVLMIGDSGVGKSGLVHRLTRNEYKETDSTDGAWATIVSMPDSEEVDSIAETQKEVWLWDFAGQQDYRLLHQLFMDETALAVFVFNPQSDNPFEGLGKWDEDIKKAAGSDYAKILVAGRVDRGDILVSAKQVDQFVAERGFKDYIETSSKTGKGCDLLLDAVRRHINWENLPRTISPRIFRRLKEEILSLRDGGVALLRREELRQRLEFSLGGNSFTEGQFDTVISLLAGPGIVWKLDFGDFILLRPEEISAYSGAVVREVRAHPEETGYIPEENFVAGDLDYQDRVRLPCYDEEIVLRALLQTLINVEYVFDNRQGTATCL